jgi:hypothetical protein
MCFCLLRLSPFLIEASCRYIYEGSIFYKPTLLQLTTPPMCCILRIGPFIQARYRYTLRVNLIKKHRFLLHTKIATSFE